MIAVGYSQAAPTGASTSPPGGEISQQTSSTARLLGFMVSVTFVENLPLGFGDFWCVFVFKVFWLARTSLEEPVWFQRGKLHPSQPDQEPEAWQG